ncbi:doublecortin domain-containing protein 2B isoform X2 [Xenopus laevis]|uniref:Doublecortin domain-containing protein 2B isoform X2 n=1 Tax=Xenopus laevis TaxID=8355 RepID=A0A8J0UHT9_XENLA|nr:doublecortin domain-containing protein 2B isoform X2 [Xenopus laevis]
MSSPSGVQMAPLARNVVVYRNGDPFHTGRKMVVNEKQFLTFEAFLNEVTSCIEAPVAIRSIYTPRNGHRISQLGDLLNKGHYVAGGTEKFRKLDYQHTEIKQPAVQKSRDANQVYPKLNFIERWRKDTQLPCVIHVFRNGDLMTPPYRVLLYPIILKEWELVLSLLTQKVNLNSGAVRKLCTLDGVSLSNGAELVSGEYYVALGSEKYKCLPYQELLTLNEDKGHLGARRKIAKAGEDGRRVHSTGAEEKSKFSGPKHPSKGDESVFYAKPVRVYPKRKAKPNLEDTTGREGVFKVKETRQELEGAREVKEDAHTHVELPVDQRVAEVVHEEYIDNESRHPTEDLDSNYQGKSHTPRHRKKEDVAGKVKKF